MSENTVSIFERAVRLKLRFDAVKGQLTAEDLWDLPLRTLNANPSLDNIAKQLFRDLKAASEVESFVVKSSKANETLQLKFDVVKHVIDVRLAEAETAKTRAENREKKDRVLEILAQRKDKELESKSEAELLAMVEVL